MQPAYSAFRAGAVACTFTERFFVDKVAKHLFLFEGDGVVRDFQGTFTEYLDYRQDFMKPGVSETIQTSLSFAGVTESGERRCIRHGG